MLSVVVRLPIGSIIYTYIRLMDSIKKELREANVCFKCRQMLDTEHDYDNHLEKCQGEKDDGVITTKFYSNKELFLMNALNRKKSMRIESTVLYKDRPATR